MSFAQAQLLNLSLTLVDTGELLPLAAYPTIVIGRSSQAEENETIEPFLDLSPYSAYTAGVSRRHAQIEFHNDRFLLTDLESTNGTRLNGEVLPALKPTILNDQDIITLGSIKIRATLEPAEFTSSDLGGVS